MEWKAMADEQGDGAWRVFFSYSHKDQRYRKKIDDHLSMLTRSNLISRWYDHHITPGKEFDQEIAQKLDEAHIVLLLVSDAFLSSDYCFGKEMKRALQRH